MMHFANVYAHLTDAVECRYTLSIGGIFEWTPAKRVRFHVRGDCETLHEGRKISKRAPTFTLARHIFRWTISRRERTFPRIGELRY